MNKTIVDCFTRLVQKESTAHAASPFKARHFERVVKAMRALPMQIQTVDDVRGMTGFGKGTLQRIDEILRTGGLAELNEAGSGEAGSGEAGSGASDAACKLQQLQQVTGIGSRKARDLLARDITLPTLLLWQRHAEDGSDEVDHLRECGLTHHQRLGVRFFPDLQHRIPHSAIAHFDTMLQTLLAATTVTICGSYRRGARDSGDIDMLLTHDEWGEPDRRARGLGEVVHKLRAANLIVADLTPNPSTKYMGFIRIPHHRWVGRLDVRAVAPASYCASVLYFTGSQQENIRMRRAAKSRGWKLNEYGLFDGDRRMSFESEEQLYELLGEPYRAPRER